MPLVNLRNQKELTLTDVFHPMREDFVAMLNGTGEPNSDE